MASRLLAAIRTTLCVLLCGTTLCAVAAGPSPIDLSPDEVSAGLAGAGLGSIAGDQAGAEPQVPADNLPLNALASGRYAELELRYNALQAGYDAGQISDLEVNDAFDRLSVADPRWHQDFDGWVAAYPKSYVARLARAAYLFEVGVRARGDDFAADTPQSKFQSMESPMAAAKVDLEASLALDPKPIVSYVYLIRVGRYTSDAELQQSALEAGLKLEPTGIIVRRTQMATLQTRWGGSLEATQQFVAASKQAGVSAENMKVLRAQALREEAWLLQRHGDQRGAVDKYQQAADLLVNVSPMLRSNIYPGILFAEGHAYERLNDYQSALNRLQLAADAGPNTANVWSNIGYCQQQLGHPDLALAAYRKSTEYGDAWAMNQLGEMLYTGNGAALDKKQALALFLKSSALGNQQAATNLYWAEKQMGMTK